MKFQPNSTFLFTLAGLVILFVIAQSIFFLVRAYRRGKSLGIETAQMKKTILSTQYLPWLRLCPYCWASSHCLSFWGCLCRG